MPDCPVKREVCSWILFSLSSKLSYHLLPHSFIFILIYNLPGTVDCHSLTPQRIIEGASRGYTVRENSLGGAACTGLIDVTQRLGQSGSWHKAETRPGETIQAKGESQKNNWKLHQQRPFKKCSEEKKKKLKRKTIVS